MMEMYCRTDEEIFWTAMDYFEKLLPDRRAIDDLG